MLFLGCFMVRVILHTIYLCGLRLTYCCYHLFGSMVSDADIDEAEREYQYVVDGIKDAMAPDRMSSISAPPPAVSECPSPACVPERRM